MSAAPLSMTVAELVSLLPQAEVVGDATVSLRRLVTDSRSGVRGGDLFVGLVGPRFDGCRYAAQVLEEGAAAVLVSGPLPRVGAGQAAIRVEDTTAALQAIGGHVRRSLGGRVLGITGSNGKTVVKDMLALALTSQMEVSASPRSWNSQVGVALALLQASVDAELHLVECGISQPGEMERLHGMVRPDIGVFTNVGDAHLEGLGDRLTTAAEKAKLFVGCDWVVVPEEQKLARDALAALGIRTLTVGPTGDVEWTGRAVRLGDQVARLELDDPEPVWLEDAALAAAVALELGAAPEHIEQGLRQWRPAPMRLEISKTPQGVVLINDAYTADPESMEVALSRLVRERSPGRMIAVLGGLAQQGDSRRHAHERVGRRVVALGLDRLITIGGGGAEIADAAARAGMSEAHIARAVHVEEAALTLQQWVRPLDRVLLKGSRPDRLERLAGVLVDAFASAQLEVDLDQLAANFHWAQAQVGPDVGVMPVVKAFGYGLDATRIASRLQHEGAVHFQVAYPDEGAALREGGVTVPILVQNVVPQEVDKLVRHRLSAQISTVEQARLVAEAGRAAQEVVRCHVKVDTGMGRSGAKVPDVLPVLEWVHASDWLQLDGLMTHFAAAEDPAHDVFTLRQVTTFAQVARDARRLGITPRWVHACNSAGISRWPEAHHSMVRLGLGLLGYAHVEVGRQPESPRAGWRPILRLTTRVVSVKALEAGDGVGYGLTWTAQGPCTVAVVALGYADGYPWSLSNQGWMTVNGVRCPVIGRVCMDVTLLDVSQAGPLEPGDEVVVFGPGEGEPDLVELAALAGTIPYEMLTRLTPRIRRIFHSSV